MSLAVRDLPHDPRSAAAARRELSRELGRRSAPTELAEDVELLVSELVGNAVLYADPLPGGVVRIAWEYATGADGDEFTVRVTDGGGSTVPVAREVPAGAEHGRGLKIVSRLAVDWGVDSVHPGHSVWAVLRR